MVNTERLQGAGHDEAQVVFGQHILTLIDLLGQKSELAKWDSLPESDDAREEFYSAVRNSYGKVLDWRSDFEKYFHQCLDALKLPDESLSAFPDGGESYRQFAHVNLSFMHFSDTIIIYSPVVNEFGHANATTVYAHVYTCGVLMLAALNKGDVFRGAIEIGMAAPIRTNEVYGPALAVAHHLESNLAKYPRILVGPRLDEYLTALALDKEDSPESRANATTAPVCQRLIGTDLDQHRILDYMGAGFRDLSTDQPGWKKLRHEASAFVERELGRFRSSGNDKLVKRYERMLAYCRSRNADA